VIEHERQEMHESHRAHARKRRNPIEQPLLEIVTL
jgi:hypothetical protein